MFNKSDENIVVATQSDADLENTPAAPPDASVRRIVEEQEDKDLARALTQRHIQMIALAGAIVSPSPSRVLNTAPPDLFSRARVSSSLLAAPSRLAAPSAP